MLSFEGRCHGGLNGDVKPSTETRQFGRDVTTTMLWVKGEVTPLPLIQAVLLPSIVCAASAAGIAAGQFTLGGSTTFAASETQRSKTPRGSNLVFATGVAGLLAVPIFKQITGLPPYLGMLLSLGAVWSITDRLHGEDGPRKLKMEAALARIDTTGILFFTGILMAIGALQACGVLTQAAGVLSTALPDKVMLTSSIGVLSSIIDNVPIVAATQGMYDLSVYPTDSLFWDLIAYCAGTGGSLLIIGSAAGIAFSGLEKDASFSWYLKKISPIALISYTAGIATLVALPH
jgi:Na+/H+ antiporter NhaD/arsenite permease-like protein